MKLPLLNRLSRRARILSLALLALVCLGGALALLFSYTVLAAPPLPYLPLRTIPETDLSPYGANFFLEREVEAWKREKTVQMARDAGIRWAREQFPWEEIEPERGVFDWSKYDDMVSLLDSYGIKVIARLDRPPLWARSNPSGTGSSGPPDNLEDYGAFVEAFALHFKGRIYYLQIWNEPNLAREWNDGPIDPAAYVRMLKIAYARAKAVDPNIRILTAPLAITLGEPYPKGTNVFRNMNDLQFLQAMYDNGAQGWFDILSANAFGLGSPPEEPADPEKLNFRRVSLEHDVMVKNGDSNKSVWIDEYGWNAPPASIPDSRLIWGRVTEEQQADYTTRGIQYARQNWPWVGVISVWFFRQVGDLTPNNPEYYFRMVDVDFTPRPVYARFKQLATSPTVANPGEYEEGDPALQYSGDWTTRLDPSASGGADVESSDPSARVSIRFYGEGLDIVARESPGGGRLNATLDGRAISALPRDSSGRSYLDLAAPQEEWQAVIPVARGLSRGLHVLDLAASGEVNLDGLRVQAIESTPPPWGTIGPLLAFGLLSLSLAVVEWQAREVDDASRKASAPESSS